MHCINPMSDVLQCISSRKISTERWRNAVKKTELEKWYEPLEPHFNSISDAMPSMRFATIEAVLHLLYINAPEADPQKAYLLFAQYQLIGITQCSAMDHLLQNARHTFGYYRSRKYWQDDFSEYCDPKYSAIRAFSVTSDAGGLHLTKAETGYPYSYEKRCMEWNRFWNTAGEKKQELPVAVQFFHLFPAQRMLAEVRFFRQIFQRFRRRFSQFFGKIADIPPQPQGTAVHRAGGKLTAQIPQPQQTAQKEGSHHQQCSCGQTCHDLVGQLGVLLVAFGTLGCNSNFFLLLSHCAFLRNPFSLLIYP